MTPPTWMEMGHEVRASQIKRYEMRARERRTGGRALQEAAGLFGEALLWSRQVDQLDRDFAEYRKRLADYAERMGKRVEREFGHE